jgi:DNA-binding NtrC family response regulator
LKRILLVDDDLAVLGMLSRALTSYDVMTAHDGTEALAKVADKPIDLLITDYFMPEMTGEELVMRLRAEQPNLKAIMISGHGDLLDRDVPEWWQQLPHLAKPFRLQVLRETVETVLRD